MLSTRRGFHATVLGSALCAVVAALPAAAQHPGSYPSKPIKVIVPFPPGGGGDNQARLIMSRAAKELGQPVVFENIAGAGGNVGSATASRAPADGYTLLYGTNGTLAINHTLYKTPSFSPLKDLPPITQLTRIAAVVVVRPDFRATTMPELLKLLSENPGKYTFASAGNGTTSHLAGEILKSAAGLSMVHIPYRGGAPAMTDLLGGQVDMMLEVMPSAAPQVKAGKLRALAVTTAQRVDSLADVPSVAESGVKDVDVSAWDASVAPAGTPPAVISRIKEAVHKALADPELRKQLAARGAEAAPSEPQALRAFIQAEIPRWGAAVERTGARVD